MLSPVDVIVIGAAGLLFFGPDQLPKVARKVGTVMRDVQMTSQSFLREMERAADEAELRESAQRPPVEHLADPTPAPEPFAHEVLPDEALAASSDDDEDDLTPPDEVAAREAARMAPPGAAPAEALDDSRLKD